MAKQNTRTFGETPDQAINILGEGTLIKGDISASSDIRIDGQLVGNLEAKGRVVIGPKGKIEGKVICNNVEIAGLIKGKVTVAELLNMKASAKIEGDIIAGKLAVEPGATFTGTCSMGGVSAPVKEDVKEKTLYNQKN
ncbi:polymer-forming cytoskeletal protein [Draconibacterium sp. IB214405]|uniref:bactofilin family protein n=1 Tax=Draconibacterium sp. IB214405 TaxID=3097352 RepID=UPI002A133792|nr:polymer-forming cytoskeletal protein [Draconibacterium sp. IB214405]MDX8338042.1 polymer-forming cytoskeletal protein [Draconibacterium sp. IB214405]